ncbi:MICAL-like protein 1 isoform X2 [Alosa sapidissima]|uniref:MICAL-like protein 1 isoform X2 n=1 Tax=Alosa sapidissima TaxID=34773 RepID=UPI001C089FFB|nr:MICAL-like protein 1 isoform X2 [Alosa sapidissima]
MGSQKLLQDWCRLQCEHYSNVEIRDLTTSFKDGLAFCAIIHKHRPDLLDFHSLSKEKGYENNRLAFEVAETHLGIPALLDPADMVSPEVPDRLSVITYLSQYFTYFAKTSDAGFSNFLMSSLPSTCTDGKKGLQVSESSAEKGKGKGQTSSRAPGHLCSACQKQVHLVQRHIVDGKLYHRSCFKCSQCSSTLFPGSYRKGDEAGSLLCSHLCIQKPNGLPKQHSLADPGEALQRVTQDVPCSTSLTEKHSLEVDKEKRSESQLPESTNGHKQCIKYSGEVDDKKKSLPDKEVETEKAEGKQTLEKQKLMDVDTKKLGVSAGTGSSPALAGQSGTNSRPVPAPRRAKARQQESSRSNPPWPPPRAHPAKVMNRSLSENHEAKSGEEGFSVSRSSDKSSENQKPKSPPWLDLIHPGPWAKLPPVPLPPEPPRSCSVPFLSEMWSRRKAVHLSPHNPFDEEDVSEGLEGSHKDTWTACSERDESQVQVTMVTSQTWCGTSVWDQANAERSADDNQTSKANIPQSAECTDTPPARKGESISEERGVVCSAEDSNSPGDCPLVQANAPPNMAETECLEKPLAETNGTGNVAPSICSSCVSDLAETAGSVCTLNLAKAVTVPEATRLESPAGRTELESLPKSALASAPQMLSETDVCQEQDLPKSLSEVQLSTQDITSSTPPSASCSDRNTESHSQPTQQLPSDGLIRDREPPPPPTKPYRNKRTCKENPFNRTTSLAEIPSASCSSSTKAAAPGHGFPLIKRKVETDRHLRKKDLQTERGELERRLNGLEQRGVELERSLRNCHNEKEDDLLVNWFTLIHEKHMLVRRDAELVYMAKQQNLEERQSDVEYELRCLFNKPEKDWSKDDEAREKQLMSDLVTIIEQRNQIINSLDQDRQREQEEDMLLEDMIKKRDSHRNEENDQRIFAGKFKPIKMLKQLGHKTESKKGKSKISLKKKS